jgi:pimeloyl-ACP methyl ester carboxylesterase
MGLLTAMLMVIFQTPDIPVSKLKESYGRGKSRYLPVNGMSVHYRDEGPATDSLPLVLLHGSGSSLHTWDSLVILLTGKRCIRVDLPGFGLTGPHPQGDYRMSTTGIILDSVLRFLKVDSCIMAGNSLGGLVAWTYAAAHPKVEGLILLDPAGLPSEKGKGGNLAFRLARIPGLNKLLTYITPKSLVEKSLKQSYADPARVTPSLVQRYYDLNLREGNRQAFIDRFTQDLSVDTAVLRTLHMPVLLIWGEKDQVIPFSTATRFQALIPSVQLVSFPELGHVPQEESPAIVASSIRAWLLQHRP